jgi:hypothetical protein
VRIVCPVALARFVDVGQAPASRIGTQAAPPAY